MSLSARMEMVSHMVTDGNVVADIGTDHAYVPIHLIRHGHCPRAIAMDINRGPVEIARRNIDAYGMHKLIETRLSDGLKQLRDREADTIILAGMGGGLIVRILSEGGHALKTPKELVLQPQSEWAKVRHFIHEMGYRIEEEDMVKDDGKFYVAMRAIPGFQSYYDEYQYQFGGELLRKRHPVLLEYLQREKRIYSNIGMELLKADTEQARERLPEVGQYLDYIEEALDYYGMS